MWRFESFYSDVVLQTRMLNKVTLAIHRFDGSLIEYCLFFPVLDHIFAVE